MTQYIVLRAPDLNFKYDGWWYERESIAQVNFYNNGLDPSGEYIIVPTHRFERRKDDGATAKVFEVKRVG